MSHEHRLHLAGESKKISGALMEPEIRRWLAGGGHKRKPADSVSKRLLLSGVADLRAAQVERVKAALGSSKPPAAAAAAVADGLHKDLLAAVALGHALAGYRQLEPTDLEKAWVARIAQDERGYLQRWLAKREAAGDDARADLYGGAIDSAFQRGWAAALPDDAQIWWMLSPVEHCPDCLKLAADSPYTGPGVRGNPLPTVPGNGDTRCLANCRCFLRMESSAGDQSMAPQIGAEVIAIGGHPVDPSSDAALAAAALYQPLAEAHAWNLRMAVLDPANRAFHLARAESILADLKRRADAAGHAVRLTATDAEIMADVDLALAAGLKPVLAKDLGDDLLELIVLYLSANDRRRGTVKSVRTAPPTVTDADGTDYRIDERGGWIVFRE